MKQLLKWIIPLGALLLIGIWIGLNWNHFPANEEVFIPVVKKQEAKYDTSVSSSVEFDSITTPSIVHDKLVLQADSINAEIASMEENASKESNPGEVIEPAEESEELQEPKQELPVQPKKIAQQKHILNTSEQGYSKKTIAAKQTPSANPITTNRTATNRTATNRTAANPPAANPPATNRAVATNRTLATNRTANPEQPGATANRILTPSPVMVKTDKVIKSNNAEIIPAPTQKKQVVFDSYMSKKQIPVEYLVEVDGSYKPSASGKGVSAATFIVYNRSGKNLKKVSMEVQYLGKGNQLLRKLEMPVSNISADGAVSVEVPANTEADRLVYKVLYVSSVLGDFYYEPLHIYANASR